MSKFSWDKGGQKKDRERQDNLEEYINKRGERRVKKVELTKGGKRYIRLSCEKYQIERWKEFDFYEMRRRLKWTHADVIRMLAMIAHLNERVKELGGEYEGCYHPDMFRKGPNKSREAYGFPPLPKKKKKGRSKGIPNPGMPTERTPRGTFLSKDEIERKKKEMESVEFIEKPAEDYYVISNGDTVKPPRELEIWNKEGG